MREFGKKIFTQKILTFYEISSNLPEKKFNSHILNIM